MLKKKYLSKFQSQIEYNFLNKKKKQKRSFKWSLKFVAVRLRTARAIQLCCSGALKTPTPNNSTNTLKKNVHFEMRSIYHFSTFVAILFTLSSTIPPSHSQFIANKTQQQLKATFAKNWNSKFKFCHKKKINVFEALWMQPNFIVPFLTFRFKKKKCFVLHYHAPKRTRRNQ